MTVETVPQSIEVYGDQDENYAELSGSFPLPRSVDGPLDISSLVSIRETALDPLHVVLEIPFYEDDAVVADWDTGDFHPGIVATPPSDWALEFALLSEPEADAFIQSGHYLELFLKVPVPELGLTLVAVGNGD